MPRALRVMRASFHAPNIEEMFDSALTARYVVMAPNGAGRLVSMAAMMCSFSVLLRSEALCFDDTQIFLLQVQSKPAASMTALQPLHGCGHNFAIYFMGVSHGWVRNVASAICPVAFCTCIMMGRERGKRKDGCWRMFPFRASR